MENTIIKIKCPHCQQPLAFKRPDNGFGVSVTCPKCENRINVQIREKAIRMPEQKQGLTARLEIVEGPQAVKKTFTLHRGGNIIGRKDEDTEQDIEIEGDVTISRRSVELGMFIATGGNGSYSYRLNVLNAKNPVYVNGTPLHQGNSITLRPGDTIVMGNTKLMFSV